MGGGAYEGMSKESSIQAELRGKGELEDGGRLGGGRAVGQRAAQSRI